MYTRFIAASAAAFLLLGTAGIASADTVTASCTGTPSATSILWSASATGGTAPYTFLWGNGVTGASQTVNEVPGTYSMMVQATDSSSTPTTSASSTCMATVAWPTPTITAFTATPASINAGGSSVLSWTVSNASSTSIDNGVGVVSSTSITVMPNTTTTYTLSAMNPSGTVTAHTTVTVGTTTTTTGGGTSDAIKALLQQIAALQAQLAQLLMNRFGNNGTGTSTPTVPPGQIGKLACQTFGRNLKMGDKGDDVMKLQQILAADPSSGFTGTPTGFFGTLTMKAVMKFQINNGIVTSASGTTGLVGPMTIGFLNRSCGKGLMKDNHEQGDEHGPMMNGSSTPGHMGDDHGQWMSTTTPLPPQGNQWMMDDHGHGNGHGNDY